MAKQYRDQPFLEKIGKQIVKIRQEKGISQEKLSELTGLDTRQIGRLERAETNASISILKLLADKLDISIRDFF